MQGAADQMRAMAKDVGLGSCSKAVAWTAYQAGCVVSSGFSSHHAAWSAVLERMRDPVAMAGWWMRQTHCGPLRPQLIRAVRGAHAPVP